MYNLTNLLNETNLDRDELNKTLNDNFKLFSSQEIVHLRIKNKPTFLSKQTYKMEANEKKQNEMP